MVAPPAAGPQAHGQGRAVGVSALALGRGSPGSLDCRATVGQLGHVEHNSVHKRKAVAPAGWGGVAQPRRHQNPVDSPDGGGEAGRPVVAIPFALGQLRRAQDPPKKEDGRMIIKRRGKKA